MLIDNVIVVIESIFRNREQGLERREAIITAPPRWPERLSPPR
jgi:multidrug efflux pump subunit AcrB